MSPSLSSRGQPLVVLSLIIAAWVSARALLWNGSGFMPAAALASAALADAAPVRPAASAPLPSVGLAPAPAPASSLRPLARRPLPAPRHMPTRPSPPPTRPVAGKQTLFAAALSDVPPPGSPAHPLMPSLPPGRDMAPGERRWSADAWLLLRPGGDAGLGAATTATYGASQAGAVVRYRLAPGSEHRPTAYARVGAALNGSRQKEAALGLSLRPIAGLPLAAAAELRVTDDRFGSRTRPVASLITELPPFRLPGGFTGEAYAQAGYAGGRGATAFVDGQLRADRQVARIGSAELRAGGGVWGGAQKGASRLDAGPSATLGLPVSDTASARMALDWRFRIDGRAAPSSGPAFTLSAGF